MAYLEYLERKDFCVPTIHKKKIHTFCLEVGIEKQFLKNGMFDIMTPSSGIFVNLLFY